MCLRYGHGVKDDDKVIHCLRAGLSDSVVRVKIDYILRALQTQIGTCLYVHLNPHRLRSAAHEVTGIARTVDATTASSPYTLNRRLFHRPIRLDAGATSHFTVALLI